MNDNKGGYNVKTGIEWCGKPLQMESLHPSQPQRKRSQEHEEAHSGWEPESHVVGVHDGFNTIQHNQQMTTNVICLFDFASVDGNMVTSSLCQGFFMWEFYVFVKNKL